MKQIILIFLSLLTHDCLLPCYGFYVSSGFFYYLYPLMDMNLFDYLQQHKGTLDVVQKWAWLLDVARGLHYLHEKHIYHL